MPLVSIAAVALVISAIAFLLKGRVVALLALSLVIGLVVAYTSSALLWRQAAQLDGYSGSFDITLVEDGENRGFGESALARARFIDGREALVTVRFGAEGGALAGERFAITGSISGIDLPSDPFAWSDGVCATVTVRERQRREDKTPLDALRNVRREAISYLGEYGEAGYLLQALVCGYRGNIRDTSMYQQFQTCGLAHLVAVSGAHLVIVTALFAAVLKRLRASRRFTIAVIVAAMASYYVLAGMPVSALRAAIMAMLGLFSFFGKRRASSLNAVGISVFVIIGLSPASCIAASFTLSALSTIGIVLFAPLFSWHIDRVCPKLPKGASDALSLTFSASVLSQLYACSLFSMLPVMSPIANLVVAPLFPVVCSLGLLSTLIGVASFPFCNTLAIASSAVAGLIEVIVGALSRVPYAAIPVYLQSSDALAVSVLIACLLWITWLTDARIAFPVAGLLLLAAIVIAVGVLDRSDQIVMLDVGQGDAFLIKSQGRSLLVDTGNQDSRLLGQLGSNGIIGLDAVLITHADDDHCGSLDALQRAVRVDRVMVAKGMSTCEDDKARDLMKEAKACSPEIVELGAGDEFSVGRFNIQVIWPRSFSQEGGNADSVCMLVDYDAESDGIAEFTTLMTGDAEKDQIRELITSGVVRRINVLKVGHHGSRNGLEDDEAQVLDPQIALVSCGKNNRYGHPARETISMLEGVGARVFRTDEDGQVRCTFNASDISVTTG